MLPRGKIYIIIIVRIIFNTIVDFDELYKLVNRNNFTMANYMKEFIKRVRKYEAIIGTATQNLGDFLDHVIEHITSPSFNNPTYKFIFYPSDLDLNKVKVEFIENHEGFSTTPYRGVDAQNLTIGYGNVIQPSELTKYTTLTKDQAETLLMNNLSTYVSSVQNEFQSMNLSQNQYDALVDLSYNLGQNIGDGIDLTTDIKSGASANVIKTDFECLDSCN